MASLFWKNNRTNIALVVALLGTAAFVFATRDKVTTGEKEARKTSVLKIYRPEALTEIKVVRGGQTFRLHRKSAAGDAGDDHLWRVEDGGQDQTADQFAIDKVLTTLEFAFPQRAIKPEEVQRGPFGLDAPRWTMTLTMGTVTSKLIVGGDAPRPEASEYVDVDGEVMVVKKDALAAADIPADAYRTRTVVPYLSSELAAFSIESGGKKHAIERGKGTTWRFAPGGEEEGRIDRLSIDRLLTSWADLKADSFLAEDEAKKVQAGAPVVRLTMQPTDKTRPAGDLVLGGTCPGHPDDVVVVRTLPSALSACTAKGVYEALRTGPQPDRHPFSYREDEVEEMVLSADGKKLELARKEKGWHERAPVEAEIPLEMARALVKTLASTQADVAGRTETPKTLESPRGTVSLRAVPPTEAERPAEMVELGREASDGRVPVRRVDDGLVLWLTKEQARGFLPRETALRSLKVIDVGVDKVRKLVVTSDDVKETLERSGEGVWSMPEPKGYAVDLSTTSALAEGAAHLLADAWVADRDDGSFGLGKPRLRVDLTTREGAGTTYKLVFGDTGAAGLYGKLEGQEGVFVVSRATEETFRTWAIDLTPFVVDVSQVATVTLSAKKRTLSLLAQHEQYKVAEGGPEVPAARLDALREALHDLRAEAVVHLGAPRKSEGFDAPTLEITITRPASVGDGKPFKMTFGAGDSFRETSIFYARREGIDAVFAIPAARVRAILAALG